MTAEYIPTEIGGGSSMKEEYERRELQQRRHYFLFSQLQNMARELPGYVRVFTILLYQTSNVKFKAKA
jgi:hypothetical protein